MSGEITGVVAVEGGMLGITSDREVIWSVDGATWEVRARLEAPLAGVASDGGRGVILGSTGQVWAQGDAEGRVWASLGAPPALKYDADPVLGPRWKFYSAVATRQIGGARSVLAIEGNGHVMVWEKERWSATKLELDGVLQAAAVGPHGEMTVCGTRGYVFLRKAPTEATPEPAWENWSTPMRGAWASCMIAEGAKGLEVVVGGDTGAVMTRRIEGGEWSPAKHLSADVESLVASGRRWYAVAGDGVWSSADGGRRWTAQGQWAGLRMRSFIPSEGGGWALSRHRVFRQQGSRWTLLRGESLGPLRGLAVPRPGVAVATGEAGLMVRVEGGEVKRTEVPAGSGEVTGVAFGSGKFGWASTRKGGMLKSADGGRSWSQAEPSGVELLGVAALDAANVLGMGRQTTLRISGDLGATWQPVELSRTSTAETQVDLLSATGFGPEGAGGVLVGGEVGVLFVSTQGVRRFEERLMPGLGAVVSVASHGSEVLVLDSSGLVLAGEVDALRLVGVPVDHAFALLAAGEGGVLLGLTQSGLLLRSADSGGSWGVVTQRSERSVYGLRSLGEGRFLMVGQGGLMQLSEDGGVTWEELQEGRSQTLMGVAQHRGALYTGGFGGHLLRSEDGGRRWAPWEGVPEGLRRAHITTLDADERQLVLGAVEGLWSLQGEAWTLARAPSDAYFGEVRRVVLRGEEGAWGLSSNGSLWRAKGEALAQVVVTFAGGEAPGRLVDVVGLPDGRLVVSAEGGVGVGTPSAAGLELRRLEVPRGTRAPVGRLEVDPSGRVWLGGPGGIWSWDGGASSAPRQAIPALPERCHSVVAGPDGAAHLGCDGGLVLSAPPPYLDWTAGWTGTWGHLERLALDASGELWAISREGAILRHGEIAQAP